jgi:uncharacterized protein (DUF934 family)
MPLIKNRQTIADGFQSVAGDNLPEGDLMVDFANFMAEPDKFKARNGALAVKLSPDQEWEQLLPHLDRLQALVLVFPKFSDGRHYSNRAALTRTPWVQRRNPGKW